MTIRFCQFLLDEPIFVWVTETKWWVTRAIYIIESSCERYDVSNDW